MVMQLRGNRFFFKRIENRFDDESWKLEDNLDERNAGVMDCDSRMMMQRTSSCP